MLWSCSGGVDGNVRTFDLATGEQISSFQAASDTVNGFQFHPYLPLAAAASGDKLTVKCWFADGLFCPQESDYLGEKEPDVHT